MKLNEFFDLPISVSLTKYMEIFSSKKIARGIDRRSKPADD